MAFRGVLAYVSLSSSLENFPGCPCRTALARLELHSDGEMRLIFDNEMQAVAEILGAVECRGKGTSPKDHSTGFEG